MCQDGEALNERENINTNKNECVCVFQAGIGVDVFLLAPVSRIGVPMLHTHLSRTEGPPEETGGTRFGPGV